MSSNILFHSPNLLDTAVLTASTENPDWPVENLQTEQRSETFRTTDDDDEAIVINNGSAKSASYLVIPGRNHNLSSAAVIRIQGNASDSWGSPTFNEIVPWYSPALVGSIAHKFAAAQSFAYYRLFLDDAANPDGYLELGRVILGVPITPAINYSWGYRRRVIDLSDPVHSLGDQRYTNLKGFTTETDFFFKTRPADVAILEAFFRQIGIGKHFAVSFNFDNNPNLETFYGYLTTQLEYSAEGPQYSVISTITFREAS